MKLPLDPRPLPTVRVGRRASWAFAVLALTAMGCNGTLPPPTPGPPPAAANDTQQSHLLLFPESDAQSLLGRAVSRSADGSWTMTDARAPGCEVSVTHEKADFHTSRKIDAHSMTSIAAGYAKLVSLEVKLGRQNTADIDIHNSEILRADMRGACGELVVDTVFVGRGKRRIYASAQASAGADVHVGVVNVAPSVDTGASQADALEWTDDQAYGFSVKENSKTQPLDLKVGVPSIIDEGDNVTARFETASPAWLVVYYIDGSGHGDVLWPSNEEREPHVTPDAPAILPSEHERSQGIHYRATLLKPGQPSRETLVVYAFADQRDFDAMKPSAGGENADGAGYAAELTKKLQSVPMSRWSRAVVGYVIQPKH